MADSVGIACIGAGTVSQLHAAAINTCQGARLTGFYDIRQEQAEAMAQTHGCQAYATIDDLLNDPAVQAVVVASPLEAHFMHASRALEAGKHVLIEKPVAVTREETEQLESIAQICGKVCMPAHNYIYAPELRRAQRLISTASFGRIVSAWIIYTLHHPPAIAAKYPGVLRQIMTHHFYSLLYLLGKPVRLTALASETRDAAEKLDREDQVALLLEMSNGALVNLFASFAADDQTSQPWTVTYKVLGTEGGSVYSWRDNVILAAGAGQTWRYLAYEESFMHEMDYFVHQCIQAGEAPLSTMRDAIVAQMLIEAAEEALRTGRTIDLA